MGAMHWNARRPILFGLFRRHVPCGMRGTDYLPFRRLLKDGALERYPTMAPQPRGLLQGLPPEAGRDVVGEEQAGGRGAEVGGRHL
jgi:hypothetical protein